jgi:predicted MFS family arabinose efflux permease
MLRRNERILLLASDLWFFGEGLLGPLFAVFTQRIGGNVLDITWAWAVYLLVSGALVLVVGKISDHRFDKAKLMVLGYAINALFTFGYLLVSSPLQLLIVQAGLGVGSALAYPTWEALYAKYEDKKEDGWIWGLADGGSKIFTGIGMIVGGFIVTYGSFAILFWIMGIVQTIATIYQARILKK